VTNGAALAHYTCCPLPRINTVKIQKRYGKLLPSRAAHDGVRLYKHVCQLLIYVLGAQAHRFTKRDPKGDGEKKDSARRLSRRHPLQSPARPVGPAGLGVILDTRPLTAGGDGRAEVLTMTIDHVDRADRPEVLDGPIISPPTMIVTQGSALQARAVFSTASTVPTEACRTGRIQEHRLEGHPEHAWWSATSTVMDAAGRPDGTAEPWQSCCRTVDVPDTRTRTPTWADCRCRRRESRRGETSTPGTCNARACAAHSPARPGRWKCATNYVIDAIDHRFDRIQRRSMVVRPSD